MTVCVMQVSLEVRVTVGTFSPSPCPLFPICFLTLSPLDQDNNKNGFCFKILLFNNIKNLLKNNALLFDNIHLLWTYGLFLQCYETQQLVQPSLLPRYIIRMISNFFFYCNRQAFYVAHFWKSAYFWKTHNENRFFFNACFCPKNGKRTS